MGKASAQVFPLSGDDYAIVVGAIYDCSVVIYTDAI
jgi:hypothetical protein